MIIRKTEQQLVIHSPFCGELREILQPGVYPHLDLAIAQDIGPTKAHYHNGFDEIYFVMDGDLSLRLWDPAVKQTQQIELSANELCVITRGVHHVIARSSESNRLCVITIPRFDPLDEVASNRL